MNFDETSIVCSDIRRLGDYLLESHSAQVANELIQCCARHRPHLHGRFGNVREQIGRVMRAAALYTRQSFDWQEADWLLQDALTRVDIALAIHQQT